MRVTVGISPSIEDNFKKAFSYLRPTVKYQGDSLNITYKTQIYKVPLNQIKPPTTLNIR